MNETDAMTAPKIIQMMPAEGWYAFFRNEEDDSLNFEPLVCFALTENSDGETEVRPMFWQDSYVDFADDYDNFEGIEQADLSENDWDIELEDLEPEDVAKA
ncbi:MAG TPA: hypothetical protein ENO16_03590 [Chromatiales bacterium]|nr:hypothetical protein [Chromatiales bacterium]